MRRIPRLLALALAAILALSGTVLAAPAAQAVACGDGSLTFSGGDGSTGSPFLIADENDLEALRDANATGAYDGSTHGYYDCAYLQTADIIVTSTWKHGIGFTAPASGGWWAPFQGVYDGGGHSVSNLVIDPNAEATASHQTQKIGFIGSNQSGTGALRNLNLVNASVLCGPHAQYAGMLVGETLGAVERSSASGTVDCTGATYAASPSTAPCFTSLWTDLFALGGLIGATTGTVSNAWVSGMVKAPTGFSPCEVNGMGGAIGNASGATVRYVLARSSLVNTSLVTWLGMHTGRVGSLTSNFANSTLNTSSLSVTGAGPALPTADADFRDSGQLQDINTYSGWSISAGRNTSTIWGIDPSINGGFPFLQALPVAYDPSQVPPPILQQLPVLPDGTCAIEDDAAYGYGAAVHGGWGSSWAQWAQGGAGGPVCTRTLVYTPGGWAVET